MFDFVTNRKWFFLGSGIVILICVISLAVSGLNLGIEFSSGTTMTLVFQEDVSQEALRDELISLDHPEAIVQRSTKDAFLIGGLALEADEKGQLVEGLESEYATTIRVAEFSGAGNATALAFMFGKPVEPDDLNGRLVDLGYSDFTLETRELDTFLVRTDTLYPDDEKQILEAVSIFGPVDSLDVYSISPDIASERVDLTTYAVIAATVGILLYITWAFRRLASSFRYGLCAILALVHDALVVLGVFSLFRLQVDSVFIIAILFVIGYSVNNTIVIFDRIRENRTRDFSVDFGTVVNMSLTGTLGRSLNTSLTTLFVLLSLYLFGGETIGTFVLALIIGVVAGTYSSLFIAGQLLVSWEHGEFGRLVRRVPLPPLLRRG